MINLIFFNLFCKTAVLSSKGVGELLFYTMPATLSNTKDQFQKTIEKTMAQGDTEKNLPTTEDHFKVDRRQPSTHQDSNGKALLY